MKHPAMTSGKKFKMPFPQNYGVMRKYLFASGQRVLHLNQYFLNSEAKAKTDAIKVISVMLCSKSLKIQKLHIADNALNHVHLCYLSCGISKSYAIDELDVSYNNLDKSSLNILAKGLQVNRSLTTVHLHHNNLDDGCMHILENVVAKNRLINTLYLHNNQISQQKVQDLCRDYHLTCTVSNPADEEEIITIYPDCKCYLPSCKEELPYSLSNLLHQEMAEEYVPNYDDFEGLI